MALQSFFVSAEHSIAIHQDDSRHQRFEHRCRACPGQLTNAEVLDHSLLLKRMPSGNAHHYSDRSARPTTKPKVECSTCAATSSQFPAGLPVSDDKAAKPTSNVPPETPPAILTSFGQIQHKPVHHDAKVASVVSLVNWEHDLKECSGVPARENCPN